MTESAAAASMGGVPFVIHTYEHRAYRLPGDRPFIIGRDSACDITVNEVAVSRRHAEIQPSGEGFAIVGTGSTPTFVNGMPLAAAHELAEGDVILVGTMKFTYTRERLPVAMAIAAPARRESRVDDRRPTLTFPTQPAAPEFTSGGARAGLWVALGTVVATAAAAAAWLVSSGH